MTDYPIVAEGAYNKGLKSSIKTLQIEIARLNLDLEETVHVALMRLPIKRMSKCNTTNVKNMHLHRDSNPGPWNTVPIL